MSVAPVAVAMVLALSLGGGLREVGVAAARRARAQTAADAAALAAVAESLPGSRGAPVALARRFALANGARLIECLCDPGARAMQVEVIVEGVVARARAAVDPAALAPSHRGGLHPELAASIDRLLEAAGGAVWVTSGFRAPEDQERLWRTALQRYGDPETADDWVARPGRSLHEKGLAVDLGGDLELAARLVRDLRLPLWRPMSWEPWHFELEGSRD